MTSKLRPGRHRQHSRTQCTQGLLLLPAPACTIVPTSLLCVCLSQLRAEKLGWAGCQLGCPDDGFRTHGTPKGMSPPAHVGLCSQQPSYLAKVSLGASLEDFRSDGACVPLPQAGVTQGADTVLGSLSLLDEPCANQPGRGKREPEGPAQGGLAAGRKPWSLGAGGWDHPSPSLQSRVAGGRAGRRLRGRVRWTLHLEPQSHLTPQTARNLGGKVLPGR